MKKYSILLIFTLIFCLGYENIFAQKLKTYTPIVLEKSASLQTLVNQAADETIAKFSAKGFKNQNLAITLIDLRNPNQLRMAEFRGDEKIYPASVVKMFYDVALHQWIANGKLKMSPAIAKAEKDMIIDSSNEATQYIVDVLTGTTNGEELSPNDLKKYGEKRDIVNRYFASLGYKNLNISQKTYCESLYGRERQWWNEGKNRNMLTTNAVAQLLSEIALGKAVNAEHSKQMMDLMSRNWEGTSTDNDDQAHGFTGIALKNYQGAKLWSKAGWTSDTRHDAAYIELPNGLKFVLVTFTTNFANEREIIPTVAEIVLKELGKITYSN